MDRPPIGRAAVLIGSDGRIEAVGPSDTVPTPSDAESLDLGDAVLLPGLVNTHTHLELTSFEESASEPAFRDWILTIRRIKAARGREEWLGAARRGIRDCWALGVTTIADTGDSGAVIEALAEMGGSGIVYHEVFGPHPDQCEESLAGMAARVGELARFTGPRVRLGVSPHAPYTVSGPLYARVAEWARHRAMPVAVHLAESLEETRFVTRGEGPFAEAWAGRGIPGLDDARHHRSGGVARYPESPVQWLDMNRVLGPDTLCIHTIQLSERDIRLLAERGAGIAHCPLSNARHGHGAAPLSRLLEAGLRVGVGTDSVASVGRLDLLAEARAARKLGGLDARQALELCTIGAARAIGLDKEVGSLTSGKWGDVVAVGIGPDGREAPEDGVLASSPGQVVRTVVGGRMVYRRLASR